MDMHARNTVEISRACRVHRVTSGEGEVPEFIGEVEKVSKEVRLKS